MSGTGICEQPLSPSTSTYPCIEQHSSSMQYASSVELGNIEQESCGISHTSDGKVLVKIRQGSVSSPDDETASSSSVGLRGLRSVNVPLKGDEFGKQQLIRLIQQLVDGASQIIKVDRVKGAEEEVPFSCHSQMLQAHLVFCALFNDYHW